MHKLVNALSIITCAVSSAHVYHHHCHPLQSSGQALQVQAAQIVLASSLVLVVEAAVKRKESETTTKKGIKRVKSPPAQQFVQVATKVPSD